MGTRVVIKNMVCNRCISAVRQIVEQSGLTPLSVGLGEAEIAEKPAKKQWAVLDAALLKAGFERLDDQKRQWIEKTKNNIVHRIHHAGPLTLKENWSRILAADVPLEYGYLSTLFSSVEGITIEQFIIRQKIERVKELLCYDEMSLGQIADVLGYSSVSHLSAQFKKITGTTPSGFKKSHPARKPLDLI